MIKSKRINIWIIAAVILVLLFTIGFTYFRRNNSSSTTEAGKKLDYATKLFDKDKIMNVDIQIDEDTWNSMIENASSEEYVQCDVVINGEKISDVGIRPKGNTSLSQIVSDDTTDRFSFKIEFDHYVYGRNCLGLDKLVLNNLMSDSTYMKDYLSYDLMNYEGVVTPLYSYASITVNGKEWGLYLALESMEESFAFRNYGSDYGQLYKPETTEMGGDREDMAGDMKDNMWQGNVMPGATDTDESGTEQSSANDTRNQQSGMPSKNAEDNTSGTADDQNQQPNMPGGDNLGDQQAGGRGGMGGFGASGGASLQYTDDEVDSYSTIFSAAIFDANQKDYKRVIEALKNLNEGKNLEDYVDVEANLKYIATNAVLVNLDSYFSSMQHNYYLYEQDGVITMLPWDYNLAFAGFQSQDAASAINFPIDTPVSGIEVSERPMIGKLLEVDEYSDLYHEYLQDIVTGYFDSGLYESTIEKVNSLISDYVKKDATAFYTYDEYTAGVETILQFGLLRAKSIQGQLDGTIPSTQADQEADATALIDADTMDLSVMGTQGGGNGKGMNMANNFGDNAAQNTETNADTPAFGNDQAPAMNGDDQVPMNNGNMGQRAGFGMQNTGDATVQTSKNTRSNMILYGGSGVILVIGLVFALRYQRRKYRS